MAKKQHVKALEALKVVLERLQIAGMDNDCKIEVQIRGRQIKAGVTGCPMVEMSAED